MYTLNLFRKRHFVAWKHALSSALALFLALSSHTLAAELDANPAEVGDVTWRRDYPGALAAARESGKPIFLFFQEVPGCIGCQTFGQTVLKDPLLVEAIEDEFIPVLVYNNRLTGMDAKLLKHFGEPSWNYQVIRFIDADQKDIIARRDRVWDLAGLAARMGQALEALDRPVPRYLQALAQENDMDHLATAIFSTACFWTGEHLLGRIDGVVWTEAGWYGPREVTLVRYHSQVIDLAGLVEQAAQSRCAQAVYANSGSNRENLRLPLKPLEAERYRLASKSDQKRQLQLWLQKHQTLYLSPMQLTRLNAIMPENETQALSWLSPSQRAEVGR